MHAYVNYLSYYSHSRVRCPALVQSEYHTTLSATSAQYAPGLADQAGMGESATGPNPD